MSARWWVGQVMLGVGLTWWAVHRVLVSQLPSTWGGPNVGAGFLLLIALGVGLGDALLVGSDVLQARREGTPFRRPGVVIPSTVCQQITNAKPVPPAVLT